MNVIYNIGIYLLVFVCKIGSLFSKKLRMMLQGQKQTYTLLNKIKAEKKTAWFHCASLGEFEQARNLIEYFRKNNPQWQILVSFFSPSGYEIRKNYNQADCVVYLPFDTKRNAKRFVSKVKPDMVFFVKYEFWYNYIRVLKNIPLYQVSLILRQNHYLLKPYSFWFRKQLKNFNHFFVQNETTKQILASMGYENVTISGDTRFDRVYKMSKETKDFPLIEKFCQGDKKILVAGSSWEEDEKIISSAFNNDESLKIILAPHLIDKAHIDNILSMFDKAITYSTLNEENIKDKRVLIIDSIGILSYLYRFADIVHIGGGFGVGIHNILEAAVFSKPISFGPNYKKFQEAVDLIKIGAAKSINNADEIRDFVQKTLYSDEQTYKSICQKAGDYVQSNVGATDKILNFIHP